MNFLIRPFLLILFLGVVSSGFSQGIEFEHVTWQEALAKAKENNKLLFVDAYAQWCGPCKRMAKNEFVKPDVGEVFNLNFVNLKLDMESKNGRTFDSQYPVSAYPTMLFLDGDGNVVKKVRGARTGDQLIQLAGEVLKGFDTSGEYQTKYDNGDRSYDVVYNLVEALNKVGKPSLKISNDYLLSNPDITKEERLNFIYIAVVDADSRLFKEMTDNKDDIIELVSEESYNQKVLSACNNTLKKAIEYESEMLFNEAVEKVANVTSDEKVYELELQLEYAKAMNNETEYIEKAKSLGKEYKKNHLPKMKELILDIQSNVAYHPNYIELSEDLSKTYHKEVKNADSALIYAKALILVEDYKKAQSVIEKAMKDAEKNGESTKTLEMMLTVIEKRRA